MVSSHHGAHGIGHSLEVVETVMEIADVAWKAYEHRHGKPAVDKLEREEGNGTILKEEEEEEEERDLVKLRAENCRLKSVLGENLNLLNSLSKSLVVSADCPEDLYVRLVTTVESLSFLSQIEALKQTSTASSNDCFPFKEVQGKDLMSVDILVYDDRGEPSRWVWVIQGIDSGSMEEFSGIDNENYVVINEEHVVDGIANFMAKCIITNPMAKRLSPDELQKKVAMALSSMKDWSTLRNVWKAGKLIYALSTWGIALSALYSNPVIVKAAATGITTSAKFVMKAL